MSNVLKPPHSRHKSRSNRTQKTPTPSVAVTLHIDSAAFGGDGIGRLDGKVYFVADALPEQTVSVRVTEDKGRFAKASIEAIIDEAPYTLSPPCQYAMTCGGCQWQKVPYPRQLDWKAGFIRDALQRIGGISPDSYAFTMQAAPASLHYRNRINLKCELKTDGSLSFGYFARSSHDLIAVNACLIADEKLSAALPILNHLRLPPQARAFTGRIELQLVSRHNAPTLVISSQDWPPELWQQMLKAMQGDAWLSAHASLELEDFVLLDSWQGLNYFTRPGQFQQVNLAGNQLLRQKVQEIAQELNAETVLDLYCGSGNLSLALAQDGRQVFGIEAYAPSIAVAQYNQVCNRLTTAQYRAGEAADISLLFPDLPALDLIIADPPRRGMAEALEPILKLKAKHLIYVSCDPNTLARDLKQLKVKDYRLLSVMGLDFFPHSYHVETLCLLQLCE